MLQKCLKLLITDTHCIWDLSVGSNMLNTFGLSPWAWYECKATCPPSPVPDLAPWQPSPLHQTTDTSSGESEPHIEQSTGTCGEHRLTRGQIRPLFFPSLWHWFAGPLTRFLFPSVVVFQPGNSSPTSLRYSEVCMDSLQLAGCPCVIRQHDSELCFGGS